MKKSKPANSAVPKSIETTKDNDLALYRPYNGLNEPCNFKRLFCRVCGEADFEVDRLEDGQWCVECANCGDAASMLSELINARWGRA